MVFDTISLKVCYIISTKPEQKNADNHKKSPNRQKRQNKPAPQDLRSMDS